MTARTAAVFLLLGLLVSGGCHGGPVVNTVPWWRGLPSLVIAPTSIEAEAWRRHLHAAHAPDGPRGPGCQPCLPAEIYEEIPPQVPGSYEQQPLELQPHELPPLEDDSVIVSPEAAIDLIAPEN